MHSSNLHFHSPVRVFDIILSFFLFCVSINYLLWISMILLLLSLTFLLGLYVVDLLRLLCICLYQCDFAFHNFHVSSCGLFFFSQRGLFNISCKAGLMVLNSYLLLICKTFFLNFRIVFIFLYSRFLLVIHSIHISLYMSIPISQFITPQIGRAHV